MEPIYDTFLFEKAQHTASIYESYFEPKKPKYIQGLKPGQLGENNVALPLVPSRHSYQENSIYELLDSKFKFCYTTSR